MWGQYELGPRDENVWLDDTAYVATQQGDMLIQVA